MKVSIKIKLLFILGVFLLAFLFIPFLFPKSSNVNLISTDEVTDSVCCFSEIGKFEIHFKKRGNGENVYILLHGTFADIYTWSKVIDSLAQFGTVIAYDRPPFGITSHLTKDDWSKESPYGYKNQVELIIKLMDKFNVKQAILVGNSMGGAIAALTAQYYPERIKALILVAPAQDSHGIPGFLSMLLSTPQMRRIGPFLLRKLTYKFSINIYKKCWHDTSKIKNADINEYGKMFKMKNWDNGLFEFIIAARPLEKLLRFEIIKIPTLLITGDDDKIMGTDVNISIGDKITNSQVSIIPECGHFPQEECPEEFIKIVRDFIAD